MEQREDNVDQKARRVPLPLFVLQALALTLSVGLTYFSRLRDRCFENTS